MLIKCKMTMDSNFRCTECSNLCPGQECHGILAQLLQMDITSTEVTYCIYWMSSYLTDATTVNNTVPMSLAPTSKRFEEHLTSGNTNSVPAG